MGHMKLFYSQLSGHHLSRQLYSGSAYCLLLIFTNIHIPLGIFLCGFLY